MSSSDVKMMWKIFVPKRNNRGKRFRIVHHKRWDEHVCKIAGGLTICESISGRYMEHSIMSDDNIVVMICATEAEMVKIHNFTAIHYSQKAILSYVVSDHILLTKHGD